MYPNDPLISLCAIFKDEERFLPEFIETFKNYCDELILVDTGSTDSSLEILTDLGISWYSFPWNNDFSAARNFALSKASSRWILSLDIDERMCSKDLRTLREVLTQGNRRAYSPTCISTRDFNWQNHPLKIFSINQSMFVRIFPNCGSLRFEKPIHESIVPSLERANIPISYLDLPVYHLGYAGDLYEKKKLRNEKILEPLIHSSDKNPTLVYYYLQNNWNGKPEIFKILMESIAESGGIIKVHLMELCVAWMMEFPKSIQNDLWPRPDYWEKELRKTCPQSLIFTLQKAREAWLQQDQKTAHLHYLSLYEQSEQVSTVQFFRPEIMYNLGFLFACEGNYLRSLQIFTEFNELFGPDPHVFYQTLKLYAVTSELEKFLTYAKYPPEDLYKLPPKKQKELEKILRHVLSDRDIEVLENCLNSMVHVTTA